jgi:hypothetical protein
MPFLILSALLALIAGQAPAATLTVGPGKSYATVAAGIAAAQDGDTVAVDAGTYRNDYAEIGKAITLTAVGGIVDMRSSGNIPNRKGILIADADITIVGFHFAGARVTDADGGNGAGIRYQKGKLKIDSCYFTDNQDGILGVGDGTGTVTVTRSEFFQNGAPTGPSAGLTHNLYLGGLAVLTVEGSYFHGARVGHEFKSRARQTVIRNSRFADGPIGTSSYSIDLPNGGDATITGSQIEQGPMSQNPAMIAFGEEGNLHPGSKLTIENSLIANQLKSPAAFGIWNQTPTPARIVATKVFGLTQDSLFHGPANLSGVTYLTVEPEISTRHPWDE